MKTYFSKHALVLLIIPIFSLNINAQDCSDPEYLALLSFFNATGGPSWNDGSGWENSCDPCTFYGVTCNSSGQVETITLSNNNLIGSIDPQLEVLSELKVLDLSHNFLSGSIPGNLENSTQLESVILRNNLLSGDLLDSFGSMPNLIDLDLSLNNFSGCYPSSYAGLCYKNYDFSLNNALPLSGSSAGFSAFCADGTIDASEQMSLPCSTNTPGVSNEEILQDCTCGVFTSSIAIAPSTSSIQALTCSSFTVSWENTGAEAYTLYYREEDNNYASAWNIGVQSTVQTSAMIANLDIETDYEYKIAAEVSGSLDAESQIYTFSTYAYINLNVEIDYISCDSVSLSYTTNYDPNYIFNITINGQSVNDLSSITSPGFYAIEMTDQSNQCSEYLGLTIEPFTVTENITSSICTSNSGSIILNVSGGESPYTYIWDDDDATSIDTLENLSEGTYSCIVTDASGCIETVIVTLTEVQNNLAAYATGRDPSCFNVDNGKISGYRTGGVGPFKWKWDNGLSDQVEYLRGAGTYVVEVEDAQGCKAYASVTLTAPTELMTSVLIEEADSADLFLGEISVGSSGGVPNLSYTIYDYQYNELIAPSLNTTFDSLAAGTYYIRTKDNNNCKIVNEFVIPEISCGINIANIIVNNVSNPGMAEGSITVEASSSNGPLSYNWSQTGLPLSDTDSSINNLFPGLYALEITDSAGCEEYIELYLKIPDGTPDPIIPEIETIDKKYIGAGKAENITTSASDEYHNALWSVPSSSIHTLSGLGLNHKELETARFLQQASLGFEERHIDSVMTIGIEDWIDAQLEMEPTYLYDAVDTIWKIVIDSTEATDMPYYPKNGMFRPNLRFTTMAWWQVNTTNEDLLHHRVATALSEIFVVSFKSASLGNHGNGLAAYYDILLNYHELTFEELLFEISTSTVMGIYLSHFKNQKADPSTNLFPDENYAREIMQLFSIGLYQLNKDGSYKLDGDNELIPTYGQEEISEMAKVFTGLAAQKTMKNIFNSNGNVLPNLNFDSKSYQIDTSVPMKMYESHHETSAKSIVSNHYIPANDPNGLEDIRTAVRVLSHHPNVGPFMANLLIKRLVKSNPSPEYIERVATVFNDNGSAERGVMKDVIKAILMDKEARGTQALDSEENSKLSEPMLRYTQFVRAVDKHSEGGNYWNKNSDFRKATNQSILNSPSVFNFFLPDYSPAGEITDNELEAPEFYLHTSSTSINYMNQVYKWTFGDREIMKGNDPSIYNNNVKFDISPYVEMADDPEKLINALDKHFIYGTLSESGRKIIRYALCQITPQDSDIDYKARRAQMAIYLFLVSPDFNITK